MAGRHFREEDTPTPAERVSEPVRAKRYTQKPAAVKPVAVMPEPTKRPRKRKSALKTISTLLILAGLAMLLVSGGMWGYSRYRYWKQDQTNKELATHVKVLDTETEAPAAEEETEKKAPIEVDWAALKAVNDDIVGWIYVPGTVVNYPVYQGKSNDDYLRTNALGEYSVGGQVFLDYQNAAPGMVDRQSILYGHHLWDGTMFQPLSLLDDQAVFDATDTIWYVTEKEAFELQPLFMYYVAPDDETVRQFTFASDEKFREYLKQQLAKAVTKRADAEQLIDGALRVLTMSTCNYYDGYGRSILVAIEK